MQRSLDRNELGVVWGHGEDLALLRPWAQRGLRGEVRSDHHAEAGSEFGLDSGRIAKPGGFQAGVWHA